MSKNLSADTYIGIAAIVCEHVFHAARDVMLVSHDLEGDWQFLCGKDDCCDYTQAKVVGINHLINDDQSLHEIMDLPQGCLCERKKKGGTWLIQPRSEEQ